MPSQNDTIPRAREYRIDNGKRAKQRMKKEKKPIKKKKKKKGNKKEEKHIILGRKYAISIILSFSGDEVSIDGLTQDDLSRQLLDPRWFLSRWPLN